MGTTGWTGVGGVVGATLLVHGCDVAASGINQMISNTEQTRLTSTALQSAGLSQETAETIDAGISFIAPIGPVSTLSKSEAITQVGKTVEKLGAEASKIYTGPSSRVRGSKIHKYISDGMHGKQFGDYTVKTEVVYKGGTAVKGNKNIKNSGTHANLCV